MAICCIVNCKRYFDLTNGEKILMFRAPKDEGLYRKWETAVRHTGTILKKTSFICEKHFGPDQIKKVNSKNDSEENLLPYKKKSQLVHGSVPWNFENTEILTSFLNTNVDKEDRYTNKATCESGENLINKSKFATTSEVAESNLPLEEYIPGEFREIKRAVCTLNREIITEENENLWKEFRNISLPNENWCTYSLAKPAKLLVFQKIKAVNANEEWIVKTEKQIIIQENKKIDIQILQKPFQLKDQEHVIKTLENLKALIKKVDSLKVCNGCPNFVDNNIFLKDMKFVHIDCGGNWRHNLCHIIVNKAEVCEKCLKLKNIVNKSNSKRVDDPGELQVLRKKRKISR